MKKLTEEGLIIRKGVMGYAADQTSFGFKEQIPWGSFWELAEEAECEVKNTN